MKPENMKFAKQLLSMQIENKCIISIETEKWDTCFSESRVLVVLSQACLIYMQQNQHFSFSFFGGSHTIFSYACYE